MEILCKLAIQSFPATGSILQTSDQEFFFKLVEKEAEMTSLVHKELLETDYRNPA